MGSVSWFPNAKTIPTSMVLNVYAIPAIIWTSQPRNVIKLWFPFPTAPSTVNLMELSAFVMKDSSNSSQDCAPPALPQWHGTAVNAHTVGTVGTVTLGTMLLNAVLLLETVALLILNGMAKSVFATKVTMLSIASASSVSLDSCSMVPNAAGLLNLSCATQWTESLWEISAYADQEPMIIMESALSAHTLLFGMEDIAKGTLTPASLCLTLLSIWTPADANVLLVIGECRGLAWLFQATKCRPDKCMAEEILMRTMLSGTWTQTLMELVDHGKAMGTAKAVQVIHSGKACGRIHGDLRSNGKSGNKINETKDSQMTTICG